MKIHFDNNAYFSAITDDWDFKNKKSIFHYATHDLVYKYGKVNYKKFSQNYKSAHWLKRKIIAVPAALWAVAAQTIYHLAKAVLALGNKNKSAKAFLYAAARDCQEAFGRIASLFHDRYGLYHIQESQFQKTCYRCYKKSRFDSSENSLSDDEPDLKPPPSKPKVSPTSSLTILHSSSLPLLLKPLEVVTAEEHLKKGAWDEAFEAIKKIPAHLLNEDLFVQVSEGFFLKGEIDKAITAAERIWNDRSKREALLVKIVEDYFSKNEYEQALTVSKKIIFDKSLKETFCLKLANEMLTQNKYNLALEALDEVWGNLKAKEEFLVEMALKYHSDKDKVHELLYKCFKHRLRLKLFELITSKKLISKIADKMSQCDPLSLTLRDTCYLEIAEDLKKGNKDKILQSIDQIANSPATNNSIMTLLNS